MFAITNNPPKGPTRPSEHSPVFNAFVQKCLTLDSNYRPTATELLTDPFVTRIASKLLIKRLVMKSSEKIGQFRKSLQEDD